MAKTRPLTNEQLAYARRCYLAGWGLEPIWKRLPGISLDRLRRHLWATGITVRKPGGYTKMETVLPPPFRACDFQPKQQPGAHPPFSTLPSPDPRAVRAWNRVILPGWRIHGEVVTRHGTSRRQLQAGSGNAAAG